MARPFLYYCPITGLNVQGLTSDEARSETETGRREMIQCLACGRFHLIDPSKGTLPPADDDA